MKLIYNYENGDFAVSHNDYTATMKAELDGTAEMVYVFDIAHWSEDDFIYFAGLSEDDRVFALEHLTCIGGGAQ